MKSTGVTRPIDELGRVVLPKELRKSLGIVENESRVEIFVEGQDIILRKYQSGCLFCGEEHGNFEYKGKKICKSCLKELKK
jgi:transcriptional pleiotropic regulator of transition state genes